MSRSCVLLLSFDSYICSIPEFVSVCSLVFSKVRDNTRHPRTASPRDKVKDRRVPGLSSATYLEFTFLDALLIDIQPAATSPSIATPIFHDASPTDIHGQASTASASSADGSSSWYRCCICRDYSCIYASKFDTGRSIARQIHRS